MALPNTPRLRKCGLALLDPDSGSTLRLISLQYNPDSVTRTLQPQISGGDAAERGEAVRLKGPPVETIKVELAIDATDDLESPDQNQATVQHGLQPQLAALEMILYPTSATLQDNDRLQASGTLEIVPMAAPLLVFIWNELVIPVKITDFSITEEMFDERLNPVRAKVSLGMRVLNVNDVGFSGRAGGLYLNYQRQKERLAGLNRAGTLSSFGLSTLT